MCEARIEICPKINVVDYIYINLINRLKFTSANGNTNFIWENYTGNGLGGFARTPTIGDFYDVWLKIKSQPHYELKPFKVGIVTEQETIDDFNNVRGYSEVPTLRGLPTERDSIICFESLDLKCIGIIRRRTVLSTDYNKERLTYVEMPFFFFARGLNIGRAGLEIAVGTMHDEEFAVEKKRQVNQEIRSKNFQGFDLEKAVEIENYKPEYTPEDLVIFQRFVQHIRQIKL